MNCVIYARVSSEKQDAPDKVSIKDQIESMHNLVNQQDWNILEAFVDNKKYKKIKPPSVGKVVQPSGKYDDRPGFLAMLEMIEAGQVDVVVYYDLYRFGRHHRVLGTFITAIDEGNKKRKEPIQIWASFSKSMASRVELGIMVTIGQEENEARARRVKMGKVGTLKQNRWPGVFDCLGYDTHRDEGKRGRAIVSNDTEAATVQDIFNWYDKGKSSIKIGDLLRANGITQKLTGTKNKKRRYDWGPQVIRTILRNEAYTGRLTWNFGNGEVYTIEIPQIIDPAQFERVQRKMDNGKAKSKRNTKGIYLLQNLLYCGECGNKMGIAKDRYYYKKLADGTRQRYEYKNPRFDYRCWTAATYTHEPHPRPYNFAGDKLEYNIWRYVADVIIANPELIMQQVHNRQITLQQQGNDLDSDINKMQANLARIDSEKMAYSRQQAKGQITEEMFDALIAESNEAQATIQEDLQSAIELRDNSRKVQNAMSYAQQLLSNIQAKMPEIDFTQEEFKTFDKDRQDWILTERKKIIEAVCEKIIIFADGRIEIEGLIDGDEVSGFDNNAPENDYYKIQYLFSFSLDELYHKIGA